MTALFIVLTVLLGIAIVITIAFPFVYRFIYRKKFHSIYGRKLYRLAMNKDYYLIHNLTLKSRESENLVIDHVLFAWKFIYVFVDFYHEGSLYGKSQDNSLLIKGKKENSYINNPVMVAKQKIHELSVLINFDESLFVPIGIVNDTCNIVNDSDNSLVYARKLKKVIEYYESKDVDPINQEQLMYAVHDISCINLRDVNK